MKLWLSFASFLSLLLPCSALLAQTGKEPGFSIYNRVFVPAACPLFTLTLPGNGVVVQQSGSNRVTPVIRKEELTGKYMTLECDFQLLDTNVSVFRVSFPNGPGYERSINFGNYFLEQQWQGDLQHRSGVEGPMLVSYKNGYKLARFDPSKWHCLSVSFTADEMVVYLDNYVIWAVGHHIVEGPRERPEGYLPEAFTFTSGDPGVAIKYVRIAQSREVPESIKPPELRFNAILTEDKMVTHSILFDVASAEVNQEGAEYIGSLAKWLKLHPAVKLEIAGHTDSDGDASANLKLSEQRAAEIVRMLIAAGIDAARLRSVGYGETMPLQPNTTLDGKSANRRVEFSKF